MGDWHYAGESTVTGEGKIQLPEKLFEEGILHEDRVAYWSYEKNQGFVLISDQPLEEDKYKNQGYCGIGPADDGYLTNIPKQFFENYTGRGRGEAKDPLPEKARVKYNRNRFFAYRDRMADAEGGNDKKSCYMFTWDEFDRTIGDDDWADPLSDIPRFS